MRRIIGGAFFLALLLTACGPSAKQRVPEPGGTADDTLKALTDPDEYAWQLFFFLNRQAEPGRAGRADASKPFGQNDREAPVVWETWALASGGPDGSEVFKKDGAEPAPWDRLVRPAKDTLVLEKDLEGEMLQEILETENQNLLGKKSKGTFPPTLDENQEEVRINECGFRSIVKNNMYYLDGLEDLVEQARKNGDRNLIGSKVDRCSKQVKAVWEQISESDKPRYLWRHLDRDGKHQIWGLVGLHISTKDLPNWFWADFGHRDCETQLRACEHRSYGAKTEPVDHTTRGHNGIGSCGSNGIRKETRGTVWENYILRGTQTSYTTITGSNVVLSNPVIENSRQVASCMGCHAYANIGPRLVGDDDANVGSAPGILGPPKPNFFEDNLDTTVVSHTLRYLQTDFMWSPVNRAQRKKPADASAKK